MVARIICVWTRAKTKGLPICWKAFCLIVFFAARFFCLDFFTSVTRKFATAGQSRLNPEAGENPFIGDIPDCNNTDQGEKIHSVSFSVNKPF